MGFTTIHAPFILKSDVRLALCPSTPQRRRTYCIQCVDQVCNVCNVQCADKGLSLLLLEWT